VLVRVAVFVRVAVLVRASLLVRRALLAQLMRTLGCEFQTLLAEGKLLLYALFGLFADISKQRAGRVGAVKIIWHNGAPTKNKTSDPKIVGLVCTAAICTGAVCCTT
jgi:hypothetical protein